MLAERAQWLTHFECTVRPHEPRGGDADAGARAALLDLARTGRADVAFTHLQRVVLVHLAQQANDA